MAEAMKLLLAAIEAHPVYTLFLAFALSSSTSVNIGKKD
jgi:hypothetical protein